MPYRYEIGMYGGSFDPFHIGHLTDIIKASSQCRLLFIVISYSKNRDRFPLEIRRKWINESVFHLSNIRFIDMEDSTTSKAEYDKDEYWKTGAAYIKKQIGCKIDAVFCGSDYKGTNRYESLYGPESEIVYFDRNEIPISSTKIVQNPYACWDQ